MVGQIIALVLVVLESSVMAFVIVPHKVPSRLFSQRGKSDMNKEIDATTIQHNSNSMLLSSNNNTGGVNYLKDFTFVSDTQSDVNAGFHPTVKLLEPSIDGSIVDARRLEFVRIRSMSPRQLKLWKVIEEQDDDPVDVLAVFTSSTLSNHGTKRTTITGNN